MLKKIKLFYLFLFILPIVAPISTPLEYFILAQIFLVLIYLTLAYGYNNKIRKYTNCKKPCNDVPVKNILRFIGLTTPFLAVYAAYYYTGSLPFDVMLNFIIDKSNYQSYQDYFKEQDLQLFSLDKIPAILSLVAIKFTLVAFAIYYSNLKLKTIKDIIIMIIIIISHIYISLARGTSLELFELLVLFYFIQAPENKNKIFLLIYRRISILILVGVFSFVFIYNIETRGEIGCVTSDMCYKEGVITKLIGESDKILYGLVGYFSFGLFYTHSAAGIILSDITQTLGSLFPFVLPEIFEEKRLSAVVCSQMDCGAAWQPDIITYIYNYGLILTFFGIFYCGKFIAKLHLEYQSDYLIWSKSAQFMIFLLIISLPFGNIVSSSSSNILSLILFLTLRFIKNQRE